MILFIGLLKKDLKISLPFFYKTLVIILVSLIVGSGFSGYYGKMDALTAISIALVIVQMFCLPAAVFQSLNIEGKTQLWLHNPASSLKLLLSKIIASSIYHVILTLFTTALAGILIMFSDNIISFFNAGELISLAIAITFIGLYISFWVIFYWTVYYSLASYPRLKSIRWVILVIIWSGWSFAVDLLNKLPLIKSLKKMGTIHTRNGFNIKGDAASFQAGFEVADISLFTIAGYLCTVIVLFILSSWLLDNKVEV
ncbi:hypothetical protein [Niallia sp. NCCP-28]|uniref:hypothetical protein n=1 Tax=Niallia sp. NCCP-28 TaxID=2934712 RepID=UPI00208D691D|nr:hypothetical protein [Niallia sp. NCCP-28]GKU81394.1 hypothetical protein NCCP28_07900 [Niallia sp. NCCP-28]